MQLCLADLEVVDNRLDKRGRPVDAPDTDMEVPDTSKQARCLSQELSAGAKCVAPAMRVTRQAAAAAAAQLVGCDPRSSRPASSQAYAITGVSSQVIEAISPAAALATAQNTATEPADDGSPLVTVAGCQANPDVGSAVAGVTTRSRSALPPTVLLSAQVARVPTQMEAQADAAAAEADAEKKAIQQKFYAKKRKTMADAKSVLAEYGPLQRFKAELQKGMPTAGKHAPKLSGPLFCLWMQYLLILFEGVLSTGVVRIPPQDFKLSMLVESSGDSGRDKRAIAAAIRRFVDADDDPFVALFLVKALTQKHKAKFIRQVTFFYNIDLLSCSVIRMWCYHVTR